MSSRLSKIRSVHTYVMLRTVYFGWICSSSAKIAHIVAIIEYVKPCASTILEETGSFNGHHQCTMYQNLQKRLNIFFDTQKANIDPKLKANWSSFKLFFRISFNEWFLKCTRIFALKTNSKWIRIAEFIFEYPGPWHDRIVSLGAKVQLHLVAPFVLLFLTF